MCSRAVIIAQGRVVADATPAELEAQSRYNGAITLQMPGFEQAAERLKSLGGVRSVELDAGLGSVTAFAEGDADLLPAVEQLARDNNWDVRQIYRERGRLDDAFRQITQEVALWARSGRSSNGNSPTTSSRRSPTCSSLSP